MAIDAEQRRGQLLEGLLEVVPNAVVWITRDGEVLLQNVAAEDLRIDDSAAPLHLSDEQLTRREALIETRQLVIDRGGVTSPEFFQLMRNDVFIVEPMEDVLCIVVRVWPAVDELRGELASTRALMHQIIDNTPAIIYAKDLHGRYKVVNKHALATLGRSAAEVLGRADEEIFGPGPMASEFRRQDLQVIESQQAMEFETTVELEQIHYYATKLFPLHSDEGHVKGVAGISTEITSRVEAEQAIREREELFRLAFDHASSGMALLKLDGTIERVNNHLANVLGRSMESLVGTNVLDLVHPNDQSVIDERVYGTSDSLFESEVLLAAADGSALVTQFSASVLRSNENKPLQVVVHVVDITEERAKAERARQAEKLELISRLTGGIAHDINNILGVILGHADLLLAEIDDPELREDVESIANAAVHAGNFTNRLLGYTRREPMPPTEFAPDPLIREVSTMIKRTTPDSIAVELDLDARGVVVRGDPSQLQSAVLNLAINARDAIEGGGRITFRTRRQMVDGAEFVRLIVEDTGCGLTVEEQRRVFEPFYTTKSEGHGTGLGLPSVLGAAHSLGGSMELDSRVGEGTAFSIRLPIVTGLPHDSSEVYEDPGFATVLVVDDDPAIRKLLDAGLSRFGYDVHIAEDGARAVEILADDIPLDAIIFDLKMPHMDGTALHSRLLELRPSLAAVLMTGNLQDPAAEQILGSGGVSPLQKPFRISEVFEILKSFSPALTPT